MGTDNNELTSGQNENPPPVSFLIVHHLPGEPRRRPECTINGGKLCAGAGCCYDNGQDWFCCCDKKHCAATKDDCPSKCLPEETEAQADDIQALFKKFLSTLFL